MPHILKSDEIEISIDLPDEGYQGARFDWSGKITAVRFRGSTLTTFEKLDKTESTHFGKALYNEFGIDTALGFEEASVGGWFHKIGVGLLRKQKAPYCFADKYEIQPCKFTLEKNKAHIIISCSALNRNGYAYELTKEIKLVDTGFEIRYELFNSGEKPINTDEYCHNFLAVAGAPVDGNYKLQLPLHLDAEGFDEVVNPDGVVFFDENILSFKTTAKKELFFSNITQGTSVKAQWRLHHKKQQLGIQEAGSFQTNKINIWGSTHVISPELFYKIDVAPGKRRQWSRRYSCWSTKTQSAK